MLTLHYAFQTHTSPLPSYYVWDNHTTKNRLPANTSPPPPRVYINSTTTRNTQPPAAAEGIEYTATIAWSGSSRNGSNNMDTTHD